jgi:uncharacterized membrane protein YecN with MAPEG domain
MIGKVTALYAGLLALLLVAFSIQVIRLRWRYRQGLAGRVAHGWGLSRSDGPSIGRAAGMFLTFSVLIFGGLLALYWALLT